jgi:hypothetical protein
MQTWMPVMQTLAPTGMERLPVTTCLPLRRMITMAGRAPAPLALPTLVTIAAAQVRKCLRCSHQLQLKRDGFVATVVMTSVPRMQMWTPA